MSPARSPRRCTSPDAPCFAAIALKTPRSAADPREIQREELVMSAGGAIPVEAARAVARAPAVWDTSSFHARQATAAAPMGAANSVGQIFLDRIRGPFIAYPTRIRVS